MFVLPTSTKVDRVIPKNAFDNYADTKAKKLFVENVEKIKWLNKLSFDTVNLPGKEVKEIQIFEISLRKFDPIPELVKIIDKAIPYPILFVLTFEDHYQLNISVKHPNPINEDNAVIDWTFKTEWLPVGKEACQFHLKQTIDYIFQDICIQLSNTSNADRGLSLNEIVTKEQKLADLKNRIKKLESAIAKTKQFNKKVEFNLALQKLVLELQGLG
ncbi:Methyl-accepting chemotaxis protein [Lunatimonas lonarensis]|uniref:Methyl-accepting chemotaxis protein n=1 Tax=Lunatimonas lonarensis TaxID=1232681 RepID=R7ZVN4_9BACT|nr:DUF4391 domain-containing protein [Lunatimonas lonarensis]EON78137.1 Methyl-accepting chemotaxis protein [Lunatimonas lonarensis]